MDIKVPLKMLKFGHEDGEGINARVTGRDDGIAALAVNLRINGQIENLIVKEIDGGCFAVANGNRRLAAFHMIYGHTSDQPIGCTLHNINETTAFEFSLATAITARQLHPVDQYEAFARLEEHGKTNEEIAAQYGMSEKEVRQALALGRLSPKIRQSWRAGTIKADVAKAFTLGLDHKAQDKVYDKLAKGGTIFEQYVKQEFGADGIEEDIAQLLGFVGAEAYRSAGGIVTEDLFGNSHIISDEALLKQMSRQLLIAKCDELIEAGWGWAEIRDDLPHGSQFWPPSQPKSMNYEGDEKSRFEAIKQQLESLDDDNSLSYAESEDLQEKLERELAQIGSAVRARSFDAKKMKTLGCIVGVEDGRLGIAYGIKKPVEAKLPSASSGDDEADQKKPAKAAKPETPAQADEEDISQALLTRLSIQLTNAAATALIQDEQLALSVLIAGAGCYSNCGVKVSVSGLGSRGDRRSLLGAEDMKRALPLARKLKPAERITLLTQLAANALDFQHTSTDHNDPHEGAMAIVDAIDAKAFNAAARGAFDAKDYFAGVSKMLNLKAIEEALGPDLARQQAKNTKPEIVAFAIENVPTTGWLPLQLRAKGYDCPPVKKAKVTVAAKPADRKKKSARKAAPAKKAAKKSAAKKRKAS
jgi:ParB family chromosome partitioning protein